MTPISIRRAFDPGLDRVLHQVQSEDDASPTLEGFVGTLEIAMLAALLPWLVWMWI